MGTRNMAAVTVVYTGYRRSTQKTLVNDEVGHELQRADSDKENEVTITDTAAEKSAVQLQEPSAEMKMEQMADKSRQTAGFSINNRKSEEKDNIWDDFLPEGDIQNNNENKETKMEDFFSKRSESFDNLDIKEEEIPDRTHLGGSGEGKSGIRGGSRCKTHSGVKRKTRFLKQVTSTPTSTPTTTGGSHPNLGCHGNDTNYCDTHLETMSETRGCHDRRLWRRKQVTRPKCAGPVPSGDILQQKIKELHTLIMKPLIEPKQYMHQTRQELFRLQGVSHQHAAHTKDTQPNLNGLKGTHQRILVDMTSENSDDGYPALRTAQLQRPKPHRPWTSMQTTKHQPLCSQVHQERPFSAGHQQGSNIHKRRQSRHHSPQNNLQCKEQGDKNESKESSERSNSENARGSERKSSQSELCEEAAKSQNGSLAREIQHSDTHLKNSNNPALRKWLKKKNKEFRRQKAEERKRLKAERAKKQDEVTAKQEMFKDSDKKVNDWMLHKRKEAMKKDKERRHKMREEKWRLEVEQCNKKIEVVPATSLELPSSTLAHNDKKFIPVFRPQTVQGKRTDDKQPNVQNDVLSTEGSSPQPPTTKFVYRRPVSGRVRLMKLQQKQKDETKKSDQEKRLQEKKLAQEKAKKMRISYDQWLLRKREEDYAKRQEIARQKALTKSDPELDRILPEIARRRIENIQRGKTRISTGMNMLNEEVNTSFGGADFDTQPGGTTDSDHVSYKMEVSGQQKALKLRPPTTKPSLSPKESISPRRPTSAYPQAQIHVNAEHNDRSLQPNPFRLPFPPQQGTPRHVISTQRKLFSSHITQDKTFNVSHSPDQHNENTLTFSDSVVGANASKGPSTAHGHAASQDESTVQDELGCGDVKWESAEQDTSFFVTHGYLNDAKQSLADVNYKETDDDNLEDEDTDDNEKLLE